MDDAAFVDAFEDLSLPPAAFDHRGHLRLALLTLARDGFEVTAVRLPGHKSYDCKVQLDERKPPVDLFCLPAARTQVLGLSQQKLRQGPRTKSK